MLARERNQTGKVTDELEADLARWSTLISVYTGHLNLPEHKLADEASALWDRGEVDVYAYVKIVQEAMRVDPFVGVPSRRNPLDALKGRRK